jgi:hypothetical protein
MESTRTPNADQRGAAVAVGRRASIDMTGRRKANQQPAEPRQITLPTSRSVQGHEVGVLALLRSLELRRPMNLPEATFVAEVQASRLLKLARLTQPPTPTELISELPRVRVHADPDLPVSGAAHWVNGRWLLSINSSKPAVWQRFHLFHAYKHVLDHRHRSLLYQDRPEVFSDDLAELAADAFAAALLMPGPWIHEQWEANHRRVSDLAKLFQVSEQAMAYRLEDLGLRPTMPNEHDTKEVA